ncbi:MAG: restriction endonuclease subunit S [Betaproteobacteria bacterium]|nr:MAG: restriction endonuclease subunit S [Betaproteobacteria bacterium]
MPDWRTVQLHEVADIRVSNVDKKAVASELPVKLCNYMDVYGNDYIRADLPFMEATATAAEIERFGVRRGDVMITKDSETPDDIGIPSVVLDDIEGLVCGYHLAQLRPREAMVDPTYLSKQLSLPETSAYFAQRATGSTRYGLSTRTIAQTPIRLAPLVEQQRIAAILTSLDAAIEATEALIEKHQQIKAGLMHDLLTRGVADGGSLRRSALEAPDLYLPTKIGLVPVGWEVTGLQAKQRGTDKWIRTGPFGSSLKGEHWVVEGCPVVTIGSLGEGVFDEHELLFVGERDAARLAEFRLKLGDVVFSRVADVGRSVVVRQENVGWIMSSNLMRIAVDTSQVRPDFLQMLLAGDPRVKAQIRAKVNSGGREVANSEILGQLLFAWPPVDEQERIIVRVQSIEAPIRLDQDRLRKLRMQKQGLMQDLLTGKVPVRAD